MSRDAVELGDDEVHVWYVLDGEGVTQDTLDRCRALLDDEERARCDRFRVEPPRRTFLIAHALVRTTLSRYLALAPEAWRFECNDYGRPEIANSGFDRKLRFNLSHTSGLVACAVTWERELGVDVEWTARLTGGVHLARRYFSTAEVAELESVEESRQRDRFFDYWTLKEAYIKACGKGLAIPLGQFSFHLAKPDAITISFGPRLDDDPATWLFAQWSPSPEHRMAVAVRRGVTRDLQMHVRATTPIASV